MSSTAITKVLEKALSPSYYGDQFLTLMRRSHAYYHPMFRSGSATPLWHAMIFISVVSYTTSYQAYKYGQTQEKRTTERKALEEYYERHGGSPDHH